MTKVMCLVFVVAIVLLVAFFVATGHALATSPACPTWKAERDVRAARAGVQRAERRLAEARRVLTATRGYTAQYGSSVGRWTRAARRAEWPWPEFPTLMRVMGRESGGNPRILCGGYVLPLSAGDGQYDDRAGGLMQVKPAPRHWADPSFNLRYAYRHKYLPALQAYGNGWQPWSL